MAHMLVHELLLTYADRAQLLPVVPGDAEVADYLQAEAKTTDSRS
jgi:hypothetical protein